MKWRRRKHAFLSETVRRVKKE